MKTDVRWIWATVCVLLGALGVSGCGPAPVEPLVVCPGKASVAEALTTVKANARNATTVKANGTCLLRYNVEGKDKRKKESFPVKLWVMPPQNIYLQGDVAFNARGIVMGANEQRFWLAIKPKEVSSYWSGRWSEVKGSAGLMISPKVMLEALGIVPVDPEQSEGTWSLSNRGPFDILSLRDGDGVLVRRLHIYSCDYRVRKIEYMDAFGEPEIVAELDEYTEVVEGFSVPTYVLITRKVGDQEDSARVTLSRVSPTELSTRQVEYLFRAPKAEGFEHVRELVDGTWVDR